MPTTTAIPRILHHCRYGPRPPGPVATACMESWGRVLPEYRLETWDTARGTVGSPYVAAALAARKYAFAADYMRCYALYHMGGVYLDTDVEVLRPFEPLLDAALVLGRERSDLVGTAVIAAAEGHPFLARIMTRLDDEARAGRPRYVPGPEMVTEELARAPGDARILPEAAFYPYNPHSKDPLRRKPLQSHITDETFCIHHWEGSWLHDASLPMLVGLRLRHLAKRLRGDGRKDTP